MDSDLNQSLQELENSNWGDPQGSSSLEKECLKLRRVPLIEFQGSDLLLMISQDIGIEYLIPMAIERLRADPLADRDDYPGSLLCALLKASSKYWDKNPKFREEIERLYDKTLLNERNDEDLTKDVLREIKRAYLTFAEFGWYISLLWEHAIVKRTCNCLAVKYLGVIASRQPVLLEGLNALTGFRISNEMIEHLLKNKFISYDYEGSYPGNRFFRLSKGFMKQIGSQGKA